MVTTRSWFDKLVPSSDFIESHGIVGPAEGVQHERLTCLYLMTAFIPMRCDYPTWDNVAVWRPSVELCHTGEGQCRDTIAVPTL